MFSSKFKESAPAPVNGAPQPASPKRAPRSGSAPSIISSDVVLNGTLTSAGDVQIDGRVEGDVRSASLVIGESGQIQGEILADEVTVRGHVKGRIRARKVLLCAASHVEGDILHEAFAVEVGAFFEGNCRHSDNPLGETVRKAPDVKPVAVPPAPPQPALPQPVAQQSNVIAPRPTADDAALLARAVPRPAAPIPGYAPVKTGN